jgi:broad specificity phosphatase PhoE
MNHLSGVDRLANRFRVMRHGQSRANEAGVIVSRIENDRRGDYGLTELGARQARAAVEACGLAADTVIWSSDFSRARQTAQIARACLGAARVTLTEALRERCFGDLEGTSSGNYPRVWDADEAGAVHPDHGVEPVTAVLDRATALIADLERRYSNRDILLVSHGDTLQILQAGFLRLAPSSHRGLPPLATAEIRELRLSGEPARQISSACGEPGVTTVKFSLLRAGLHLCPPERVDWKAGPCLRPCPGALALEASGDTLFEWTTRRHQRRPSCSTSTGR